MIKRCWLLLSTVDVCTVTGYTRDELHALLRVMEPYCSSRPGERIKREFLRADFLLLSVARTLECDYGLKRRNVGALGPLLHAALSRPAAFKDGRSLWLAPGLTSAQLTDEAQQDGLLIPLQPLNERIGAYFRQELP